METEKKDTVNASITLPSKEKTDKIWENLIEINYKKNYPDNKIWYVTSDGAVFLENDLYHAKKHQQTLGDGEIITIETK